MPIDKSKITKELLANLAKAETPEELIALAKAEGINITKAEAEAYMAELEDVELDDSTLEKIAGGDCYEVGFGCGTDCGGFKGC
ncbi:MAG: Nif11-like leader peptide family RiPP precursor [Spirochaetia bacterium]|nr:Nif11-like leader peptide family RiPP precursor [Spirochaetia bacterium]